MRYAVYPLIFRTHRIDPDPGIHIQKKMHVIGHHFHFNNRIAVLVLFFEDHFFDPVVNGRNKQFAPVFWAENNMVFAAENERTSTMQFIQSHATILCQNKRSVNSARGEAPGRQALAPYIPLLKQVGFTGLFIKKAPRKTSSRNWRELVYSFKKKSGNSLEQVEEILAGRLCLPNYFLQRH